MKPSSILLLAAAGLSSAMPAQPYAKNNAIKARDTRSLFGHAVHAVHARDLVPLNANTAAPPPAADPAVMQEMPAPTDKKADEATAATTTTAAATEVVAAPTEAVAATTTAAATEAAATTAAAATTTAAPALQTGAVAIGNGTAGDDGKGKGKGNGNNNNGKGKGKNNGGNGNKNKGNNNNSGNGGLGSFISGALSQLGLDGVLDAGAIDKLSAGDQISLLAQIVSLQTMKDLQMVGGKEVVVVLNQGFKSSGLNVVINA